MVEVYQYSKGFAQKIPKYELNEFTYQGNFMGECCITATLTSPEPIDFGVGDWLEYRGEKFTLNYLPPKEKKAGSRTYGEAYVYDSVKFTSLADELSRCDFLDYVPGENQLTFSQEPVFAFYASRIKELTDRIQANLDRLYTEDPWKIRVHSELVVEGKYLSINNLNCWNALALVNTEFGVNFIIKNREIRIGYAGEDMGVLFTYGKGNGLYEMKQVMAPDQRVITRLRAYGSQRNLPETYYNTLVNSDGEKLIPETWRIRNLMLPHFSKIGKDTWLDSTSQSTYGIREATVYFDGNEGRPEIYPTLEGMTAEELKAANVETVATGRLDEIVSAANPEDDGKIPLEGAGGIATSFTLRIKDIGFEPQLSSSTLSLKSGMCEGREFEITACERSGSYYQLTCTRDRDEGIGMAFPNGVYPIKTGDRFVLLGIELPPVYILAAEQRLESTAREYLAQNDRIHYTYEPKIDEIFMANHPEAAANLKEGALFHFYDDDLQIDGSIIIDSLTIKEGGPVPTYEITLHHEKEASTLEKIQNSVTSLMANVTGVTTADVKNLIVTYGSRFYLHKTREDAAQEKITFKKGLIAETDQSALNLWSEPSGAIDEVSIGGGVTDPEAASDLIRETFTGEGSLEGVPLGYLSNVDERVDTAPTDSFLVKSGSLWVPMSGLMEKINATGNNIAHVFETSEELTEFLTELKRKDEAEGINSAGQLVVVTHPVEGSTQSRIYVIERLRSEGIPGRPWVVSYVAEEIPTDKEIGALKEWVEREIEYNLRGKVNRYTMDIHVCESDTPITNVALLMLPFGGKMTVTNHTVLELKVNYRNLAIRHPDATGQDIDELRIVDESGNDITSFFTRFDLRSPEGSIYDEHYLYYNGKAPLGTLFLTLNTYNRT